MLEDETTDIDRTLGENTQSKKRGAQHSLGSSVLKEEEEASQKENRSG